MSALALARRISINRLLSRISCQESSGFRPALLVSISAMAKNPHAVALGRKGGKTGGKNRWKGVSKDERAKHARKAAAARWGKKRPKS